VQVRRLCDTVGVAADGACTVGAVPLPVEGAAGVRCAALLGSARQDLQGGDGAAAEVLVRGADARVGHVDVHVSPSLGERRRREVLVQALPVIDPVEAP